MSNSNPSPPTGKPKTNWVRIILVAVVFSLAAVVIYQRRYAGEMVLAQSRLLNGFDVSNATIPHKQILGGGPPRDGIPAILQPKFVPAAEATYLLDRDIVVGIEREGVSKAYPLRILVWHEIVNDTVGEDLLVITYCPLCGTCMVFDRQFGGKEHTFGVSGLLYQSDVLMYDHQTESLWSQLKTQSVAGKMVGTDLSWVPSSQMTWGAWKSKHPDTLVLSKNTGFRRNYDRMPYQGYEDTPRTYFPVPSYRDELGNKDLVIGIIVKGSPKAYSVEALEGLSTRPFKDVIGGYKVEVDYSPSEKSASVRLTDTEEIIPHVSVYWFAWQAFYPQTKLFRGF